jgi:hypothetical protein
MNCLETIFEFSPPLVSPVSGGVKVQAMVLETGGVFVEAYF